MFTGIVQACGRVDGVTPGPTGVRMVVKLGDGGGDGWGGGELSLGDSVCVSGVCLTVVTIDGPALGFDVVSETLARTTLGDVQAGRRVNLEPSVTPSTPLGGHIVQGHIDGVGRVAKVQRKQDEWRITLEPAEDKAAYDATRDDGGSVSLMDAVIPKGSVAVDGVSLTVAAVVAGSGGGNREGFEIALIPATLERTTLGTIEQGQLVNIETDMISRTVVHWLQRRYRDSGNSGLTMDALREAGFAS
jgi:riboflavin synthase